jgi:hypothetical protein
MECEHLPTPQNWDRATREELTAYRIHVRFCASCRARVLKEAPDQLLFDLQEEPLPQDFWLGFWNSVDRKRGNTHTVTTTYRAFRWAAVFLFGALIFLYGQNLHEVAPVRQVERESYPVIESLQNPEARYYIFQSGNRQKIVMVFDPDMEL